MALSVTTIAPTIRLTTGAAVQAELGISTDGALIDGFIDGASAAIESYCNRPFARESYTQTMPGYGGIHLQLARTPIVTVSAVTMRSSAVTDYSVADTDRGWLYRQCGWIWTDQVYPGLSSSFRFLDFGTPLPGQEEPTISVDYQAGYVMPEQNRVDVITVSASAVDNSFNDSASLFPTNLKAGDVVTVRGFVTAGNTGRFVVAGTPTAAKIVVSATLTTEAAGPTVSVIVQTLPADVEKAARECVKAWYLTRRDNPAIVEKQAGPNRLRFSEQEDVQRQGLPSVCVGLLRPWVRAA